MKPLTAEFINAMLAEAHYHVVVRLMAGGLNRVLNAHEGMTFPVDSWGGVEGTVAHVRDYRFPDPALGREFQIWSISEEGYEVV